MSTVSTYLNFTRDTEAAFDFYKTVFNTEYIHPPMRFGDIPAQEGAPEIPESDRKLIMHAELPILGGHMLMGTDAPESMGFTLHQGNNVYIMLQPDTREETKRLFNALAAGGIVEQDLQDMFWGDYYGSCKDRFGVQWMFNCTEKK